MKVILRDNWRTVVATISLTALFAAQPARALVFNFTYDPSVSSAPAGFTSALNYAAGTLQGLFSDSMTVNVNVGWGEIDGTALTTGNVGQSLTFQDINLTYAQVRTALLGDQTSAVDLQADSHLPLIDPTGSRSFRMSTAEAKALNLLPGNGVVTDGFVGFSNTVSYTFNAANRAVAGEYDFIGLAYHELTEVMGRYGMTQNGCLSPTYCDSPIDLFRYTAAGAFDLNPANGSNFSIDGGATKLNTYNGTGGGDLSDWSGVPADAFNASLGTGVAEPLSQTDITLLDAIGYNVNASEPGMLGVLATGLFGMAFVRRRRR